jgi:hypothetical protein
MSAVARVSLPIKDGSAISKISPGLIVFSVRAEKGIARIVALCICFMTLVQLASDFSSISSYSRSQVIVYRFGHFPFEQIAEKPSIVPSLSMLQCRKIEEICPLRPTHQRRSVWSWARSCDRNLPRTCASESRRPHPKTITSHSGELQAQTE